MLSPGVRLLIVSLLCVGAPTVAPAAPASPQLVQRWQKAAVQKYPALGKAGSPLNTRFVALVAEKRNSDPAYFEKADWPMRAAEEAAAAVVTEEAAAKAKEKAEMARTEADQAKSAEIAAWEKEWERDKAKWVFDRLVFGDTEETILRKLGQSKLVKSRVPPGVRAALGSRFRWENGESKFDLDFEMKDGLAAIVFPSLPQNAGDLGDFVHEDWSKIREAAIEWFGPPAKSTEYPTPEKLKRGATTITDEWDRPGAHLTLGVAEDGGQCRALLRIDKVGAPGR